MIIFLTWAELQLVWLVAGQRAISATFKKRAQLHGAQLPGFSDVQGCQGEIAAAKALNLFWSKGNVSDPDIGGLYDVRAIDKPGNRLILHKADIPTRPFILADISESPKVTLRGWILAGDGQRADLWKDPSGCNRPAYFVDQSELNKDFSALPNLPKTQT